MSAKRQRQRVERTALLLGLKDAVGHRCEVCRQRVPLDGHEIRKPRARYWLNPEYVILLCRPHHEMCEAAFNSRTGRLVITGTRSTGWEFYVPPKTSKFMERAASPPLSSFSTGRSVQIPTHHIVDNPVDGR